MMNTRAMLATALLASAAIGGPAAAGPILGTPVTGSLNNIGNNVSVTTQFTSPAIVTNGTEFTGSVHDNAFGQDFTFSADFSNSALVISVTSPGSFSNVYGGDRLRLDFGSALGLFTPNGGFERTSCNPSFCGLNGLSSFTANANTITATFAGLFVGDVYRLSLTPSVPEPATWGLMVVGFGAIGFAMRRRQKVAVSYAA